MSVFNIEWVFFLLKSVYFSMEVSRVWNHNIAFFYQSPFWENLGKEKKVG